MTTPTNQQAYALSTGTAKISAFIFSDRDPSPSQLNYDLYTGWVNKTTKAVWYLTGFENQGGSRVASWRALPPVVVSDTNPLSTDSAYPIGQTWINEVGARYWALVQISGGSATWEELGAGAATGLLTLTGDAGGAVSGDGARNIDLIGTAGQIVATGTPGSNQIQLSLAGGSQAIDGVTVDAATGPGTNPVLPDGSGDITVTGAQVAAGTTANVIQTNSLAANTYSIEIQRADASATTDSTKNGVAHFNDADFTVDSNGYVSILGSGVARQVQVDTSTLPGTDPVVPTPTGVITVTGGQAAPATSINAVMTNSTAANTWTVEVQRSKTEASSTVGSNGLSHFDSSHFTVDSDGFVSLIGSGGGISDVVTQVFTSSGTYTPTTGMVYCIVEAVGGGAGGGGASVDGGDTAPCGSGGGGGMYARRLYDSSTIGASQAVTIGAAGTGGSGQADGTDGGTTSFGGLISVSGGTRGLYMRASGPTQEGGGGGQTITGTVDYSVGGGSGNFSINGGASIQLSGRGGESYLGMGGNPRAVQGDGGDGTGHGAGGAGANATAGLPGDGGDGSVGMVVVTEYIV